jgi:hypothetical protein
MPFRLRLGKPGAHFSLSNPDWAQPSYHLFHTAPAERSYAQPTVGLTKEIDESEKQTERLISSSVTYLAPE